jgi:acetoin utilization protein AcuB
MNIILDKALNTIMSQDLKTVGPNCIGSEIADLFEKNNFHHIPVVDENREALGIISASDYHQLQHHFTRLKITKSLQHNQKIFRSVLAKEIMTREPFCLDENDTIADAVDVFIKNEIHAIIIVRKKKVVGIVTPLDILKSVVVPALINKEA